MDRQERQAITIYDTNFNIVAIFDEYISLIWKLVFNDDIGGFDLEVPATKENLSIFKKDYYITRNDKNGWQPIPKLSGGKSINHCQDVMIIEAIEFNYDNDGSRTLIIGGSDITTILKRRIFAESFFISNNEYYGFFGKLGEKLQYRGLPIYNLTETTGEFISGGDFYQLQENLRYLTVYQNNATIPTTPTLIPNSNWCFPFVNLNLDNVIIGQSGDFKVKLAIIRLYEDYTSGGSWARLNTIIEHANNFYMLIRLYSAKVTKTTGDRTESYQYWLAYPTPRPNNDLYHNTDNAGETSIFSSAAINGSAADDIYPNSGIPYAEFGATCYGLHNNWLSIYTCSESGSPDIAKWKYMFEVQFSTEVLFQIEPDNPFFDQNFNATITTEYINSNELTFPDGFNVDQTPYALIPDDIQSINAPIFVYDKQNRYLLVYSVGRIYDWSRQPQFQQEKSIKHESYYDVLAEISKKYDTGLRLYPDSDLSDLTKYHYAMYDGEDLTGKDGGEVVEFSVDFENLISSNFSTDNSEAANVAYISSKYPRNPADENITEIELTTYTPTSVPETIQRREVFIDKDISYRDGEGGAILQLSTFRDLLTAAGSEALETEYRDKEEFNCQIRANNNLYHLNTDYFLGDKVLIRDIFGNETQARIQETTESWDDKGYNVDLKLVYLPTDTIMPQGVILTENGDYITTENSNYIEY